MPCKKSMRWRWALLSKLTPPENDQRAHGLGELRQGVRDEADLGVGWVVGVDVDVGQEDGP